MATATRLAPAPRADPSAGHWLTRERLMTVALIGVTVLAVYLCYRITALFIPALTWALALAIVARPAHRWIADRVAHPDLAAGLAVALVTVVIVVPATFVAGQLVREARNTAEQLQQAAGSGDAVDRAEQIPWVAEQFAWAERFVDIRGQFRQAVGAVTAWVASALTGSAWAVVEFLIVLYALFYLLRDRHRILNAVRGWVPLSQAETDEVFERVDDTIWASVYGTLMVAAVQGTLGGVVFWLLGLPAPVLWGVVMGLLAVIPFLGAFVVWAPAAVVLLLQGAWVKALLLTGWGLVVIGLIDNVLYPFLVGKQMRLHTLAVFVAIVGGLAAFGAAGVILGPAIFAVTVALFDVWRRRTAFGQAAEEGAAE
jgi:predicted PurR-regulated permease PerM